MCSTGLQELVLNSLIYVVVFPVSFGGIVPSADGGCKEIHDEPFAEARDEMCATDDIVGVEEPECTFLEIWDKFDPVQSLCFPPGLVCVVNLEPMNPEYVHAGRCSHGGV